MFLFYFHGEQYLLLALLLMAIVFIGIPAAIGLIYYLMRNRKRRLSKHHQDESTHDKF